MRKSIKQIKKQNHHLSKFQEERRSDFDGGNRVARRHLARGRTAATRTPGWKEIKNAKQNEARCFSFDLARRVQSREVKREGRMVFNSAR